MYLELFVALEGENDPLESVAEMYFSNPATYYEENIGELVLGLFFGEKYYYCIVLIRYHAIQMRNPLWVAMRC